MDDLTFLNVNPYPKLYEVLGVPTDASPTAIKEAYKRLSLENHPDRGGTSERMSEINEAWDVLSDFDKRFVYDNIGTTYNIDQMKNASRVPRFIMNHFAVPLITFLDKSLGITDVIFTYTFNSTYFKLSPCHVYGFRVIQYTVDSILNNQLNRLFPKNIRLNTIVSDIVSTTVAAPFQIASYYAFLNRANVSGFSEYFLFDYPKDIRSVPAVLKFFYNFPQYIKYFSKSYKLIAGIVLFRFAYTFSHYFLSSISDYAEHRLLQNQSEQQEEQNENERKKNTGFSRYYGQQSNNDNDNNDNSSNDNDKQEKREQNSLKWFVVNRVFRILSFLVPSTLFSVHRLFYVLEGRGNYFDTSLIRAGVVDAFFNWGSDYTVSVIQQQVRTFGTILKAIIHNVRSIVVSNTNKQQ
ncbi:hypothetical protein CYY_003286 [Polysphondylium violaceum]|uniref:J domain-containing protein n=1 Tax=Polysphondylium violaceum TaxID=133409 RepID=A0A8J4V626_9MYCE|nr:hypothetical protein CYY_003286 [Polysphondylium violaceum]